MKLDVRVLDPRLARQMPAYATKGSAGLDLRADYASRCSSVGRPVRVELAPGEAVTGEATGVDTAGRLLVRVAGTERPFAAGDVVHLR